MLKDLDDEKIVYLIHLGHSEANNILIKKYQQLVHSKASSYFLKGADHEDLIQEGMIGLFKAIRDYKHEKLIPFRAFAEVCITRQIITAIKNSTRQKHIPLNTYVSLNKPMANEESEKTLIDILKDLKAINPEELVIKQEALFDIELKMKEILTDLERNVLMFYLNGQSYKEMSKEFNRSVKAIDNALTRVKKKLEKYREILKTT